MPRAKDPRRDQAAAIYRENKGKIQLTEIAAQLGAPETTVRAWKHKDGEAWAITKKDRERSKRNTERSKRSKRQKESEERAKSIDQRIIDAVEQNDELTEEQKLFCVLYVRSFNATQSYLKSYSTATYETAKVNSCRLLTNTNIRSEIQRLKKIKAESLIMTGDDIVELHQRIAFADLTDFAEFKSINKPVLNNGEQVMVPDPDNPEGPFKPLEYASNEIRLRPSTEVDGMVLTEVSQGRDGAKVKLADRQKSLEFLERYFELDPAKRQEKQSEEVINDWVSGLMRRLEEKRDGES